MFRNHSSVYSQKDKVITINPSVFWFVTFLIGMYLELPLKLSANFIIPGFTMLLSVPFVWPLISKQVKKQDRNLLIQITIITIISIIFTSRINLFSVLFIKIVQFIVSISLGIAILNLMSRISAKRQQNIYFYSSLILLSGCFLEVNFEFVKNISDAFRSIYEGTGYEPYESANRDLNMTGFERPKFFTSEPSLVALGYLIFSTAYLLLSKTLKQFILILTMSLLFIMTCGSPINFLGILIWVVLYLYQFNINLRNVLTGVVSTGFLLILLWQSGTFSQIIDSLMVRLLEEAFIPNSSLFSRIYIPYAEALPAALRYNLAFGVGYSGKDLLSVFDFANTGLKLETDTGTNAFARFFMYFGILGGGLLLRCFYLYCDKKQIQEKGLLVFIWIIYSQTIGAMESPRYWAYLFLLIGVFRVRSTYFSKHSRPTYLNEAVVHS